jgi:ABC-type transport system involved in cytochrome c biogenesis permease subunit
VPGNREAMAAPKVSVRGVEIKLRRPWVAFFLAIVTLGIYYLYWYYASNSDLNEYGERLDKESNPLQVSAGIALLAITVGGLLIVPPFVSQWRFYKRIRKAQELVGIEEKINHVVGFLLFLVALVFLPFEIPYAQRHLNRLWEHEASEQEQRELGLRGEPATT